MEKRNVLIKLSPEAHGKLIEQAIGLGLTPTAMARLIVMRFLGASVSALDEVRA
jgi:phage terminase small subunit